MATTGDVVECREAVRVVTDPLVLDGPFVAFGRRAIWVNFRVISG
jgi:hypothetical protein